MPLQRESVAFCRTVVRECVYIRTVCSAFNDSYRISADRRFKSLSCSTAIDCLRERKGYCISFKRCSEIEVKRRAVSGINYSGYSRTVVEYYLEGCIITIPIAVVCTDEGLSCKRALSEERFVFNVDSVVYSGFTVINRYRTVSNDISFTFACAAETVEDDC